MHFVRFITSLFELSKRFATNMSSSKRHSKNMLRQLEERFEGKFDKEISKEITSMQFFAHIFVMESFVKLNKRKSNQYEIDNNIIYFIKIIICITCKIFFKFINYRIIIKRTIFIIKYNTFIII